MELTEKAAYIKGLLDGMNIDASTNEGKVLRAMSELLCEITAAVAELDDDMSVVYDQVDELDETMDALLELDEDDEDDEAEADEDELADDEYELTCPGCGAVNVVDEETLMNEQIYCGNCGAALNIEFEDEDETTEEE